MKIEIIQGFHGQWHWRIKANNGKILAHSEQYRRYRDALNAVRVLRTSILGAAVFKVTHTHRERV